MMPSHALRLLGGVSAMILLTSCQTPITATNDTACLAFSPLSYSASQDSPETVREIREFNASWRAICETD